MVSSVSYSTLFRDNLTNIFLGAKQTTISGENVPTFRPMTLAEKISHIANRTYHTKRIETLTKHYTEQLKAYVAKNADSKPKDVTDVDLLKSVRLFLREEAYTFNSSKAIKECKQLLLAAKLGISLEVLQANPTFQAFANETHLDRYLLFYNHELEVEGEVISLRYKGEMTPWNEIYKERPEKLKKSPWLYGQEGVQWDKSFTEWAELEPIITKENPEWGERNVVEICACRYKYTWTALISGYHSWFRLKTKDGKIYSFGINRPLKLSGWEHVILPLRVKPGHVVIDTSEFWPVDKGYFRSIEVEVKDQKAFDALFEQIQSDTDTGPIFQILKRNCTTYVTNLLFKHTGIDIPTDETMFGMFNPRSVHRFTNLIPEPVRRICVAVASVFTNILLLIPLGAALVDKTVTKKVKPMISSFWDIFNPDTAIFYHPHTLMNKTHAWVTNWRKEEEKRIRAEIKDLDGKEKTAARLGLLKGRLASLPFTTPPTNKGYYSTSSS